MAVTEVSREEMRVATWGSRTLRDRFPKAMIIRHHSNGGATIFDRVDDAFGHPSAQW